jgi:DHA2 family multidrug resistance protein
LPPASATDPAIVSLDHIINQQASMIAYNDDFKFMMVAALCAVPLVRLLQKTSSKQDSKAAVLDEREI